MQNLLEDLYKIDFRLDKSYIRKEMIEPDISCAVLGIKGSGKSRFVKNYLSNFKKNSYLYINCADLRLDVELLNKTLQSFCSANRIDILALDNYNEAIKLPNVAQLILISEQKPPYDFLKTIRLYPLSYEEFLANESKYDSKTLNHYLSLGGFMQTYSLDANERIFYIQQMLKCSLDSISLNILLQSTKMITQKISPFAIYERLKIGIKISKDKLYLSYEDLLSRGYIHNLQKLDHPKATKKLYICDITLKNALTDIKNFGRVFENLLFLELLKSKKECYYDDGVDFYLPKTNEIVLSAPFADERAIFKKIESIEAFIISRGIKRVLIISINNEMELNYPFAKVEIMPFETWVLGD